MRLNDGSPDPKEGLVRLWSPSIERTQPEMGSARFNFVRRNDFICIQIVDPGLAVDRVKKIVAVCRKWLTFRYCKSALVCARVDAIEGA